MAEVDILRDEIKNDPLNRGYADMTPDRVVSSLTTRNRRGNVETREVIQYLLITGKWAALVDAASNEVDRDRRLVAVDTVETLRSFSTIDLGDPTIYTAVSTRLDDLVTHGFLSSVERTAILMLGEQKLSRAEELGLKHVVQSDVLAARSKQ